MKLNHYDGYTSNCFSGCMLFLPWFAWFLPTVRGDSSQCEYAVSMGAQWYAAGYDGVVLMSMDNAENISVKSQLDSTLREVFGGTVIKAKEGKTGNVRVYYFDWPNQDEICRGRASTSGKLPLPKTRTSLLWGALFLLPRLRQMFLATLPRLCLDAHCVPGPFSFACLLILKDRDFFVNASQLRASARSLHSGLFGLMTGFIADTYFISTS